MNETIAMCQIGCGLVAVVGIVWNNATSNRRATFWSYLLAEFGIAGFLGLFAVQGAAHGGSGWLVVAVYGTLAVGLAVITCLQICGRAR